VDKGGSNPSGTDGNSEDELHPLANDIFQALVGLVPRRHYRQQLWPLLDEPLRTVALTAAADLEGAYLDAETVNGLATMITKSPSVGGIFARLYETRSGQAHPLDASFLQGVLAKMGVAERDLRWSEWIRRNRDGLLRDIQRLGQRWQRTLSPRSRSDALRAQWIMWMLTSTIQELRDQATRTPYWFGRGEPPALFTLAYEALAVNDSYVSERVIAASYGVAMA